MPLRVTLIRHGVTDWNLERRFQGHSDVPLNAQGHRQAECLAERLHSEGIRPRAVLSSDLARALETAAPIGRALELPVRPESIWRERQLGAFEGRTGQELRETMPEIYAAWRQDLIDVAPPGAETYRQHQQRVDRALDRLREEFPEGDVLVVTHGGSIYATLGLVQGSVLPRDPRIRLANTSLTRLVSEGDGWRVELTNCSRHLGVEVRAKGAFSDEESDPPRTPIR